MFWHFYKNHSNLFQKTLYEKPTDHQNYLHAKPAHNLSLKKKNSIPYSQSWKIKCVCSTSDEYKKTFKWLD